MVVNTAVFGTFTGDLERLRDLLRKHKVRRLVMGIYGRVLDAGVECAGARGMAV